ncbi:LysR family transcriptional regulator [Amantichitinum ursilacus]|uniref:HTH-type transcriptional regulator DmlR n=1 Tax=Amantichitinum ursilacus TaxID=857265 RepID=A0A0N0GQA3_9NEIS|nr:LysR family transcriptional regulator [Amantichitinum ursilacus]KPC54233.1 HTH-type transcriptional regulator DmlR [Amantichitinum ursilacus]
MAINEMRAIATFAKAVELGSLRKAAAAQGMTPQAASQALAQLEQHLGVRLLHRTTRQIALTDEGQQFLEAAEPALAALDRALERVRAAKGDIAGPLRIVGPRANFAPVLWPVIDEFCRRHPDVQPDVQLDDTIGNWVEDRVDVGFRIGGPPAEGLIARRLFALQFMICAAPEYIARHGAPQTLEELPMHRCNAFRHPGTGQLMPWFLRVGTEIVQRPFTPTMSTNDGEVELHAVLSGQVLGQLCGYAVAEHIRAGRLVTVLGQHMTDHMGVYVYYGSRAAQPARVRAFIDLVIERLGPDSDFMLSPKELAAAEAAGRKAALNRRI